MGNANPGFSEGHRERLRMRYINNADSLLDYELIELLLTYAIPRRDVKPLAKLLLREFGSFHNVFEASPEELMSVKGISERMAVLISLMRASGQFALKSRFKIGENMLNIQSLSDYIRLRMSALNEEVCHLLIYDRRGVLLTEKEYQGTPNDISLKVGDIVKHVLFHNGTNVVLIHNHPDNGRNRFSPEDIASTEKIIKALNLVGVEFYDHIVVCGKRWYRWREKYV